MRRAPTREASQRGQRGGAAHKRALKESGMAAAHNWRESRRCREPVADPFAGNGFRECRALGWQPCAHRPEGAL